MSVATATSAKHTTIATHHAVGETTTSVLFSMRPDWIRPESAAPRSTFSASASQRTGERRSRVSR
nr:hypothetical protein [Cellulosimicrobium sp. MM]